MRLSTRQWLVVGLVFIAVVAVLLPLLQTVYWVGHTDLEIEFAVTDAKTVLHPARTIDVHSYGGLNAEQVARTSL